MQLRHSHAAKAGITHVLVSFVFMASSMGAQVCLEKPLRSVEPG